MKRMICLWVLCIITLAVLAQKENVDSLINVLNTKTLKAGEQIKLYNAISNGYLSRENAAKTIEYAEKGLNIAKKEKDMAMSIRFYGCLGTAYVRKTKYDSATFNFNKGLDIAIKENNKDEEAGFYLSFGAMCSDQGKFNDALEYYIKALPILESTGNRQKYMGILANIGGIYRVLSNPERAIHYLEQAKIIAEELDDDPGKMKVYHELACIFIFVDGGTDQALEYEQKVVEISKRTGKKKFEFASNQALATLYLKNLKDFTMAEKYAKECLRLAEEFQSPMILLGAYSTLSNLYRDWERYRDCEYYAFKAWAIDSTNMNEAINMAFNIVVANTQLGNKETAVNFLKKYDKLKNQFNDKSFHNSLTEIEVKYETEKKELRIATLEKEKQFYIWLSIAGAAILLLAFGMLFYRHRVNLQKRRIAEQQREISERQHELDEQKIKQLEQEKQLIAAQSELDGEAAERTRLARDLHDGLGGLLSVVKLNLKDMKSYRVMDETDVNRFGKALGMLDESIGELRRVAHHLMPESLMRYGLRISLEDFCRAIPGANFQYMGSDTRLDSRLEELIYRCAYELVNNAVKHANATIINVQLMVDNGLVSLTVHDNGTGFDSSGVVTGAGLENIRTRVSAHNGKINIWSVPGEGTEVSIEIEKNDE